ncbi:growth arrest and DNA damage-inducible protein GADD45 alpha-like isoform X1 [Ylistrum balloti]|uniref:growth arrest and DNA damage-inducible protein GADD45 alpha-like isoform X1 n=2 Tax=Ylistrum balloti TaxID=509963 RepID=UPI002905A8BC|nr:growth arrest and DNA damage-inducible protein GADD45 alpha-like isoform X1 [Ylistrum balloti]
MTFPEDIESTMPTSDRTPLKVGDAMQTVLASAMLEGRVTCGAFECAQQLQNDPDNVVMCVLPVHPIQEDVTIQIQHTLIQAFCWENDIKVIKVDTMKKLSKILTTQVPEDNNNVTNTCSMDTDFSCVLIRALSPITDSALLQLLEATDHHIIELPE